MENEFIFTAMFAVVWLIASSAMTIVALVLKTKYRTMGLKAYNKWVDAMCLSSFLWAVFGVLTVLAFVAELMVKNL